MEIARDEMGSERKVVKSVKLKTFDGIKFGDIPHWLLAEVFVRLPVKLLFRSKLVSKQWLSLISDPSFAQMYVSRASSMSPQLQPWTFVSYSMHVQDSRSWGTNFNQTSPFTLPCPCTEHPHGTSYGIAGVSNGLVLYGSRVSKLYFSRDFHRYTICNPITGQWINLPPHDHRSRLVSTGFLTRVETHILTSYRVVRLELPLHMSKKIRFEVFLSEIGEWKKFTASIDQAIQVFFWRTPTDLNGILHWITRNHGIIAYDPYNDPNFSRFIALPCDIDIRRINEANLNTCILLDAHHGKLRYFQTSIHPQIFSGFCVWLLNDHRTADWSLQYKASAPFGLDVQIPIMFHPFDSNIMCFGWGNVCVSYNLKTGKLDHRGCLPDVGDIIGRTKFVKYEDWPGWCLTFLLMIPPWPIHIPPPSFAGAND